MGNPYRFFPLFIFRHIQGEDISKKGGEGDEGKK